MIFFSFFENFYFERNSFLKTQFDLKKLFIEILTKKKCIWFFFFLEKFTLFFLTNFIFKKELENFILVFGFLKTLKKKKKNSFF